MAYNPKDTYTKNRNQVFKPNNNYNVAMISNWTTQSLTRISYNILTSNYPNLNSLCLPLIHDIQHLHMFICVQVSSTPLTSPAARLSGTVSPSDSGRLQSFSS